jgi:hypothetical protein
MILLVSTVSLVQVVSGGTQVLQVLASWVDVNGTVVTPGGKNTSINSASTTTVVASPAASTSRNLKQLSIQNTDAAASVVVTVQHTDGTTPVQLQKLTLLAGYTLTYEDGAGWLLFNASGGRVDSAVSGTGQLLGTTFVVASGTFTTQAATKSITFELVGGGGAGGGVTVTAANGAGGGGGAGAYLLAAGIAVTGSTGYVFTAGAAGVGASGAVGGNGSSSTLVVGATTYTAPGGTGGPLSTSVATAIATGGGAGGAVATNGTLNATGAPGGGGVIDNAGTGGFSGLGGSTLWGGGGNSVVAVGNGNAGGGHGAGGSGGLSTTAVVRTGGNGTIGALLVREYS